jgi:predicted dehydrogenase
VTRPGVGVIGLGVGESLAAAFAAHPDCALVALCDLDEARLAQIGSRFPQARQYRSADALIDDPAVRIVVVASYDDHHAPQIIRALQSGRHVFAEKPMCVSEEQASSIRGALRKAPGLRLSSNTILRMSPRFRGLRDEIAAGRMGKVFYAEADYNYGRLHKLTEGWRGRIPDYSVMLGGGIHLVDLLLWLLDMPVVEVTGYGNAIAGREAGSGFKGHDLSVALLRFADGTIAKVVANFGCVSPHFHRLAVYGTNATFENALPDGLRYVSRDPAIPPEPVTTAYPGIGKGDLVPGFVDAVLGRGRAVVNEQDVFAALATCFAIDKAIATGRPQPVRDLWSMTA